MREELVPLLDVIEQQMLPASADPRLVRATWQVCKNECLLPDDCDCSELELWQIDNISRIVKRAKSIAHKFNGSH